MWNELLIVLECYMILRKRRRNNSVYGQESLYALSELVNVLKGKHIQK